MACLDQRLTEWARHVAPVRYGLSLLSGMNQTASNAQIERIQPPLLAVNRSVLFQNTVNDIPEGVQLRALRWLVAAVARWLRMPEHLPHRLSRNAKPTRRLSLAQPINMARWSCPD